MLKQIIKNYFGSIIQRVRNSSFIKSIMTLSAGVVVSQAISILTMPIISRIYTPEIIGDFSIISSSSIIMGIVVTLGLMPAIMTPVNNDESKGICRLISLSVIGLSSFFCIGAISVSNFWRLFNVGIPYWVACIVLWLLLVLTNISSVGYAYLNRQKMYKVLFWNPTIGTVSNAIIRIGLGLLGFGLWGYLCGHIVSSLLVLLHMLRHSNPFAGSISKEYKPLLLLKKHKDFPLILLPSELLCTVSIQIPVQMISRFWGSFVLGSYSMCTTILSLPTRFLAGPVNRVFYREATERMNKGTEIGDFTYRLLKANIKVAILPIVVLIILGPELFSLVLGDKWQTAGTFASILGTYQLMVFCNSCISGKFIIINKKRTILLLNMVSLVTSFSVYYICHLLGLDIIHTISVFAILGSIVTICDIAIFMKYVKIGMMRFIRFALFYLILPVLSATVIRLCFFNN